MNKSIDIEGYVLEPEVASKGRFNIFKKIVISNGKNIGKERRQVIAYAVSLDRAINIIAEDAVWKEDKHIFLNEYLEEKIKEMDRISKMTIEAFRKLLRESSAKV